MQIACGEKNGQIRISNVKTGALVKVLDAGDDIRSVTYFLNGKTLVAGVKRGEKYWTTFWDTEAWIENANRRVEGGRTIVSSDALWCVRKVEPAAMIAVMKLVPGMPQHSVVGHHNSAAFTFSSDSTRLASGGWNRQLYIWNVANGERIATGEPYSSNLSAVCFSPDGALLAAGSSDRDQYLELWNGHTLEHVCSLRGHIDNVDSIDFSPDGKILASASLDHTVKLWDVNRRILLATLVPRSDGVRLVAFSPDGTTLATGGGSKMVTMLWNVDELLPPCLRGERSK